MKTVGFAYFGAHLAAHLDRVEQDREALIVTRRKREAMVVMPLSEWEGTKETLYLLSNPANAERLLASIRALDAGEAEEHELIDPPGARAPRR